MIDYYKELSKQFYQKISNPPKYQVAIFKIINKLHKENRGLELKNLYDRLYTGFRNK